VPVTTNQVLRFHPSLVINHLGGEVILTNGFAFCQEHSFMDWFRSPSNYWTIFEQWEPHDYWQATNYRGTMNMSTNELMEFARTLLRQLGYDPRGLNAEGPPIPHCHVERRTSRKESNQGSDSVTVYVFALTKEVIVFSLTRKNPWRPGPPLGVEPELKTDYLRRVKGDIHARTNHPDPF